MEIYIFILCIYGLSSVVLCVVGIVYRRKYEFHMLYYRCASPPSTSSSSSSLASSSSYINIYNFIFYNFFSVHSILVHVSQFQTGKCNLNSLFVILAEKLQYMSQSSSICSHSRQYG